jgi:hypothetical protein
MSARKATDGDLLRAVEAAEQSDRSRHNCAQSCLPQAEPFAPSRQLIALALRTLDLRGLWRTLWLGNFATTDASDGERPQLPTAR